MNKILKNLDNYEILFSSIEGADVDDDIIITRKAMDEMARTFTNTFGDSSQDFIRFSVKNPDFFSKFFFIKFDNEIDENDKVFELGNIKIVINRRDIFYFLGIIIDFTTGFNRSGYLFIDNMDKNTKISSEAKI